jgi:hypothetical protein
VATGSTADHHEGISMAALDVVEALHGPDARRREIECTELTAAILLVADGRCPSVTITNLPDARLLALELAPFAEARRVRVELLGHAQDFGSDILVRRR